MKLLRANCKFFNTLILSFCCEIRVTFPSRGVIISINLINYLEEHGNEVQYFSLRSLIGIISFYKDYTRRLWFK